MVSHGGGAKPRIDIQRYVRLIKAGKVKFDG